MPLYSKSLTFHVCLSQSFLQQLRQVVSRMGSGPRGVGLGVKLLIGAGALAYGVKEATYTGKTHANNKEGFKMGYLLTHVF